MHQRNRIHNLFSRAMVAAIAIAATAALASACPFCNVESRTLTEEITGSAAVVLAKLVGEAPPVTEADANDPDAGKATFEVVGVLTGDSVKPGEKIRVVYFGENEREKTFMISGIVVENDAIEWTTPLPLSATALEYVRQLPSVPTSGGERLQFFQKYLENDDPLLAQDAYDEFARAPYEALHDLKPHMHREQLVEWIQSPDVNPSRRRLYLTMLGVCGGEQDLPMLESMIKSDYSKKKPVLEQMVELGNAMGGPFSLDMWTEMVDLEERQKKLGLDAAIGCYLVLRGPDGLDLIDERFLKNPKVEYTHAYMTIMALRIIGEETHAVPKERLLESMRLLLDNPEFAEQVIPDLARWEDWSVMDKLVDMYKKGDEKSYVRPPVVTYLTVASEQPGEVGARAKTALEELERLDPEGVKKARSLMAFGFLARARSAEPNLSAAKRPEDDKDKDPTDDPTDEANQAAAEGFLASAADRATENEDASGIPQPPGYVEVPPSDDDEIEAIETEIEEVDAEETSAAQPIDEVEVTDAPQPTTYSRPLVIAVPLAAACGLMAIYWLILRWGAM